MNAVPPIAVILSVWNGRPYVETTIASILGQTHGDFEFVIVDNVSTDGTRDLLRDVAARDSRVRLVFNEANLGHSGGLNRAIAEARAPWLARIDADDVALPNRLERQYAFLAEHPAVKLASCLAYYIDPEGRRVGKTFHPLATPEVFQDYMARGEMIGLLHPGVIMERALVERVGGYREAFGAANDIDLWCRMAEAGSVVLVQQERLMEYRIHPGALSGGFFAARMKYEWCRVCATARRSDRPEPAWEEFLSGWNARPLLHRVNRARKTRAKFYYRQGGLDYVSGRPVQGLLRMAAACLLQPSYAINRLRGQRLRED